MEELQPCEEVDGKQGETFRITVSIIDFISICESDGSELLNLQLHGRKQHIRALLIDRVMLQHEVRCWGIEGKVFILFFSFSWIWPFFFFSLAQKADNGGLSVQEYSPGSNERSVKTIHKHLQSSEFNRVLFVLYILSAVFYSRCFYFCCTPSDKINKLCFILQVRSKAQNVLFSALGTYNFCCRDLIPHVLAFLNPDVSNVTQQQFKVGFLSLAYIGLFLKAYP